jgi:hypothetical protein
MEQRLKESDFLIVSPKPFSSLTKTTYNDNLTMKSSNQRIIWQLTNTLNRQTQNSLYQDEAVKRTSSLFEISFSNFFRDVMKEEIKDESKEPECGQVLSLEKNPLIHA